MKIVLMILVLGTALQSSAQNEQPPAVKHPYRIMVATINQDDQSFNGQLLDLVRSKLISSLSRQCGNTCVVVEPADEVKVDVMLYGSYHFDTPCWNCGTSMQGAMRLVANDGKVIWSDTVYSSRFARSLSSSFADNLAKKLVAHLASKPLPATGE